VLSSKDFLSPLNCSTVENNRVQLFREVGFERVYETGMLYAQYMMELAEHLPEMVI
jgi:hypothetical protein